MKVEEKVWWVKVEEMVHIVGESGGNVAVDELGMLGMGKMVLLLDVLEVGLVGKGVER